MKPSVKLALALVLLCGIAGSVAWYWGEDSVPHARAITPQTSVPAESLSASSVALAPTDPTPSDKITLPPILQDTPPPEREYLQQLSALNHTDKQAALTFAEQGERWYSDVGRNAEARRAMRVTLLVDLNRMDEARRFTRDFLAKYPDSPYRRLVQGVTGIHPRPSGPRAPTSEVVTPLP
jgi:hypothetical protein